MGTPNKKVDFSLVIAAFNEENRLPTTLDSYIDYLKTLNIKFEILIVNDGSKDKTEEVVKNLMVKNPEIRIMSHYPNKGRGYSIRKGVLEALGEIILETDADGSVDNEAISRFLKNFKENSKTQVIFGSREMKGARIARHQPALRVILGYGFIYISKILLWSWQTTDFTLGFKMFRKEAAKDIFLFQFDNHYVAEAEIVYVSKKRGWKTIELPVVWSDNRDSRVHPFRDSIRSLKGLLLILWRTVTGKYS